MNAVIVFLASFVFHAVLLGSILILANALGWWISVAVILILIGLAAVAWTLWGKGRSGHFVAGAAFAALSFVVLWNVVKYGIEHPVGRTPSFRSHLPASVETVDGALVVVLPLLLPIVASSVGYIVGRKIRSSQDASAEP